MLDDALGFLACPHCGATLTREAGAVRCAAAGHSFDVARQGYLGLLPGDAQHGTADSAAMVAAREAFLGAGHFDPLAEALATAAAEAPDGVVVDVGAGTGWYLARVLDRLPGRTGIALDLSKHALRRAARAHERMAAVAADAWRPLPLREGVAGLVQNVFAPRDAAEMARVLRPGGALVVVTPTVRHLERLVDLLGLVQVDDRKRRRLSEQLEPHLQPETVTELEWPLALDRAGVRNVAGMGPSARHLDRAALERTLAGFDEPVGATASIELSVYRR